MARKLHNAGTHQATRVHTRMLNGNGECRLFFHGSNAALTQFDPARVGTAHNTPDDEGPMFFFTSDRKTAEWYARSATKNFGGSPHVMEVHLKLINPLVEDFQEQGIELLFEDVQKARDLGHDGLITLNYDDGGIIDQFIAFDPKAIEVVRCEQLPALRSKKKPNP